jgi:alkylation response protein AidB-like acyl-CoA dehydrogenase
MRFDLTDDQREFRQVAREFFARRLPVEAAAARLPARGAGNELWTTLSEQLGVHAVLVPEDKGGLGGNFLDLAMVLEEAGRALADVPLVPTTAVAAEMLMRTLPGVDSARGEQLLAALVDGAALAVAFPDLDPDPRLDRPPAPRAWRDDDGQWRVAGCYPTVLQTNGPHALLVFVPTQDGMVLLAVDPGAVSVTPCAALDPTRSFADVVLESAPADLLASDETGVLHDHALAVARVALALDSAGGARHCLEMAVEYAVSREQFGKPIGSFQAIKHKCADMLLQVEAATSAAEAAAWTLSTVPEDPEGIRRAAVLAKVYACDAYVAVAGELIQVLGGIGFTWEHPAHLFFKRAKANALLFGTPEELRAGEASALGLEGLSTR